MHAARDIVFKRAVRLVGRSAEAGPQAVLIGFACLLVLNVAVGTVAVAQPEAQSPAAQAEAEAGGGDSASGIAVPQDFDSDRDYMLQVSRTMRLLKELGGEDDQRWLEVTTQLQALLTETEDQIVTLAHPSDSDPDSARTPFRNREDMPLLSLQDVLERAVNELPPHGRDVWVRRFGDLGRAELDRALASRDAARVAQISQSFWGTPAGYEAALRTGSRSLDAGQTALALSQFQRLLRHESARAAFEPQLSLRTAAAWYLCRNPRQAVEVLTSLRDWLRDHPGRSDTTADIATASGDQMLQWLRETTAVQTANDDQTEWMQFLGNASRTGGALPFNVLGQPAWQAATHGFDIQPAQSDYDHFLQVDDESDDEPYPQTDSQMAAAALLALQHLKRFDREAGQLVLPASHPLVINGLAVFRRLDRVQAVDLRTGKPRWQSFLTDPAFAEQFDVAGARLAMNIPRLPQDMESPMNQRQHAFMRARMQRDRTHGTLATDGQRVYCLEACGVVDSSTAIAQMGMATLRQTAPGTWNLLTAIDIATGSVEWQAGGPRLVVSPELPDVFFLGPPVLAGDELFVIGESETGLQLIALEPVNGKLRWVQRIGSAVASIGSDAIRRAAACSPTIADGLVICPTTGGIVVAVDPVQRRIVWTYRYDSLISPPERFRPTPFRPVRQMDFRRLLEPDRWQDMAVIASGGRLLLTPLDSDELLCLDQVSGELLWKRSREDGLMLATVWNDRVVLAGSSGMRAVRLSDGRDLWRTPFALRVPSGRGLRTGALFHQPVRVVPSAIHQSAPRQSRAVTLQPYVPQNGAFLIPPGGVPPLQRRRFPQGPIRIMPGQPVPGQNNGRVILIPSTRRLRPLEPEVVPPEDAPVPQDNQDPDNGDPRRDCEGQFEDTTSPAPVPDDSHLDECPVDVVLIDDTSSPDQPDAETSGEADKSGDNIADSIDRGAIITIDLKTGRVLVESPAPDGVVPGNLAAADGVLVSQWMDSVVAMTSLADYSGQLAVRRREQPDAPAVQIEAARHLLHAGQADDAMQLLAASLSAQHTVEAEQLIVSTVLEQMRLGLPMETSLLDLLDSLPLGARNRVELARLRAGQLVDEGRFAAAFQLVTDTPVRDADGKTFEVTGGEVTWMSPSWQSSELDRIYRAASGSGVDKPLIAVPELDAIVAAAAMTANDEERWLAAFGWHPSSSGVRMTRAGRLDPTSRLLEIEQLLGHVAATDRGVTAAAAHLALTQVWAKSGRADAAGNAAAQLRRRFGAEQLPAGETVAEALGGIADLPAEQQSIAATWSAQSPTVTQEEVESRHSRRFLVPVSGESSPAVQNWHFVRDEYRPEVGLAAIDGFGRTQWTIPFEEFTRFDELSNSPRMSCTVFAAGHVLVVALGSELQVFDISGPEPRSLWSRGLLRSDENAFVQARTVPLLGSHVLIAGTRAVAYVDFVTPEFLIYRTGQMLHVVQLRTGEPVWSRNAVPEDALVSGDARQLVFTSTRYGHTTVFDLQTGRQIAEGFQTTRRLPLATVDSDLIVWEPVGGELSLRRVSVITGQPIWEHRWPQDAVVRPVGRDWIAVMQRDGKIQIHEQSTGNVVSTIQGEPEERLVELVVAETSHAFVVMTRTRPEDFSVMVRPLMLQTGQFSIGGHAYGIDRHNGQMLWKRPIEDDYVDLSQPANVPVLVLASQKRAARSGPIEAEFRLQILDTRTGQTLYHSSESAEIESFESTADPDSATVTVEFRTNRIRLKYGEEPTNKN